MTFAPAIRTDDSGPVADDRLFPIDLVLLRAAVSAACRADTWWVKVPIAFLTLWLPQLLTYLRVTYLDFDPLVGLAAFPSRQYHEPVHLGVWHLHSRCRHYTPRVGI